MSSGSRPWARILAAGAVAVVGGPLVHRLLRDTAGSGPAWAAGTLVLFGGLGAALWFWVSGGPRRSPTWSFHPLSATVLMATDSFALAGDAAAVASGGVGFLLVLLLAAGASWIVWLAELAETRSLLRATAKAGVAFVLVVIPTPVAGVLGATSSIAHRLARRDPRS